MARSNHVNCLIKLLTWRIGRGAILKRHGGVSRGYFWEFRNDVRVFSRCVLCCECNRELIPTYLDENTAMH